MWSAQAQVSKDGFFASAFDRPNLAGRPFYAPPRPPLATRAARPKTENVFTKCAGSLGVQAGVESADAAGGLMGRLLLFDVLPKNVYRSPATA